MSRTHERLVLIVEHDVWMRSTLSALFEQAGFDVVCASNGFGGLRRALELTPRLIVLGAQLPELSTGELAEELRTVHQFSSTHIVTVEQVLSGPLPGEVPTHVPVGSGEMLGKCSAPAVQSGTSVHTERLAIHR